MNQTVQLIVEVIVVLGAIGIIVTIVQSALYSQTTCEGIAPADANGLIKGSSFYLPNDSVHKWTYERDATEKTPCKWRCKSGYDQNENTCVTSNS